jgi:hypothetical protein
MFKGLVSNSNKTLVNHNLAIRGFSYDSFRPKIFAIYDFMFLLITWKAL